MEQQTQRRRRRETAETPIKYGVGGWLAKPPRDPITALHFVGRGFEIALDPAMNEFRIGRAFPPDVDVHVPFGIVSRQHATLRRDGEGLRVSDGGSQNGTSTAYLNEQRTWRHIANQEGPKLHAGDRLYLGSIQARALDDRGRQLVELLSRWMPRENYRAVDAAVEAILVQRPLVLNDTRAKYVEELARGIHALSDRREFPFTVIEKPPGLPRTFDKVFTRAGCGVVFIDLWKTPKLPRRFLEALLSKHYHLWPMFVGHTEELDLDLRVALSRGQHVPHYQPIEISFPEEVRERFCQENPIETPRPPARRRPARTSGRKPKLQKRDR